MGADSDNLKNSLAEQLASFDTRLEGKVDDVAMLADIQEAMMRLLADNGGSEAEIRRVLQERYEQGALRKETFQLVKSMLDRYVTEHAPTSPGVPDALGRVEPAISSAPPPPKPAAEPLKATTVMSRPIPASPGGAGNAQAGTVLRDRFMLREQVSGEGMGVVYKAIDRRLVEAGSESTAVAIKILSPELSKNELALRALQQEAAKGRCLVHPNIVRFVDFDRDDDVNFIVMEWLEGRTLADILDSPDSKSIDTDRAFRIVRQIGKALEYAHRCGIVHADVKPGNIMILPNGDAKLFDFGIARVVQKQLDKDPDFDPGVLGLMTPAYSSMQVLTGEKPVPSDDVFSLACLLYRLIAGYRVFGPRNAAQAAEAGMEPQPLDKISEANWRVLKKALAYSRVARFESMTDFLEALDVEAAESITVDIPAPTRFEDIDNEERGTGRAVLGLVVLAALAGFVANQMGWLESVKEQYLPMLTGGASSEQGVVELEGPIEDEVPVDATPEAVTETPEEVVEEPEAVVEAEPEAVNIDEILAEETVNSLESEETVALPEPVIPAEPLVDFSQLPPPTAELRIPGPDGEAETVTVRLREDNRSASVDLIRDDVSFPLTLRLEEGGFSGNRSPWVAQQYTFSDSGYLEFPVGQDRARVTIEMTSDDFREPDQQATLRARDVESPTRELAAINVILEDDDQRRYEATLPPDTVAFGASQVTVNENSPAVQLDVLRFNPGDTPLTVTYELRDITATVGEDYFAPGSTTIEFGPGQRVTRLLIPLVQDTDYEDNEAFSVVLTGNNSIARADVYRRVAILIRDDDQ